MSRVTSWRPRSVTLMLAVALTLDAAFLPLTVTELAAQPRWFVLSREDACVALDVRVRMERLPRAPATPEEFAEMMRTRGHTVTVSLPDGFPADWMGKIVMVKYGTARAPVFAREDVCRQTGQR